MTPTQNFQLNMKAIDQRARKEGMTWDELCGYTADEVLHWVIFHDNDLIYRAIMEAGRAIIHENAMKKVRRGA